MKTSRVFNSKYLVPLVLLFISINIKGQGILDRKVSLDVKNIKIKSVLAEIKKQTSVGFTYMPELVDPSRKVTIYVKEETLKNVLQQLFKTEVSFLAVEKEQEIILTHSIDSLNFSKNVAGSTENFITISGHVTGMKNQPLSGVNIIEKGSPRGAITDSSGFFVLKAPVNSIIVFSYIGYLPQQVLVNDNQKNLNISLSQELKLLQDVVIVGYGKQLKTKITGAISTIKADKILTSAVPEIGNVLAGQLSGLLVKHISSEPGADAPVIRIRGIGTFTGSQEPLILVDGIEVQNFNNIDPSEIESISVLKDATATAVYGMRGANGVLLITTKMGQQGKPVFSFTSNYAMTRFINLRKYAGSYDWAKGEDQALRYDAYATSSVYKLRWTQEDLELFRSGADPVFHPNTDWIGLMLKPFAAQTYSNFNVNGGTDRIKYFISVGNLNQGGLFNDKIMAPDFSSQIIYKRYNFRSNLDFNVTKQLTIKVNLSAQLENRRGPAVGFDSGNGTSQIIANIERVPPAMSPGIINGKLVNVYNYQGGNPLERLLGGGVNDQNNNNSNVVIRINQKLDFITRGMSIHGLISYRNYSQNLEHHSKPLIVYQAKKLPNGSTSLVPQNIDGPWDYSDTAYNNYTNYAEFGLDYERSFGNHNVTALIYYNQEKTVDPNLEYLVPHGYQGLVGRVTYDYKLRYLAEVNLGYNGTENFAKDKRFGLFPAYSLGWVVSQESFFPHNDYVTNLKIRGSYGEVGNDQVGGDRFLYRPSSYSYGQFGDNYYFGQYGVNYNGITAATEGLIGNPYLTWERAKKSNIGAEISLWKNKISITADFFKEDRDNILAKKNTLPTLFGANSPAFDFIDEDGTFLPAVNFGKMKNAGFDGEITLTQSINDKLNFWIKGNYTYSHNRIIFMDEKEAQKYQFRQGQSYDQMYGLIAEGLYNTWEEVNDVNRPVSAWNNDKIQPGDIRYKDVNGDGKIDENDEVPIGYPNFPEVLYGFTLGGKYKGFDFSILFQGASKVSLRYSKRTEQGWENEGGTLLQIIQNSWTYERYKKGINSSYPRPSAMLSSNNLQTSTWNIADASYLRLKNVEIGYTLPHELINKIGLESCRVYINGNNLITWSNLLPGEDPENPSLGDLETYPLTMTVNTGIIIKF